MFPIGVQDDDQKLAGRTSPRSHSPISSRHSATQARRLCYLTLGSATCLTPRPPTVHLVPHCTNLLSLTLSLLDFWIPPRRSPWRNFAQRPAISSSQCPNSSGTSCQATIGAAPTGRAEIGI